MLKKLILISLFVLNTAALFNVSNASVNRHKRQNPSCGVSSKLSTALIHHGDSFDRGTWPWMVSLMEKLELGDKFFCSGTYILERKVVTAAHCILPSGHKKKSARDMKIVFGAYDLNDLTQSGIYIISPSDVIVHSDWNPEVERYDADIALLITPENDDIPTTRFIKPICLWGHSAVPNINQGIITGWGKSHNTNLEHEFIPKQLIVPIQTQEHCFLDNPTLAKLSSTRTFCGGSKDGSGPCHGDSGSGFVIKHYNVFYLKGIVSASLLDVNKNCDVENYAIYTDVMEYIEWVKNPSLVEESSTVPEKVRISNDAVIFPDTNTQKKIKHGRISDQKCREYAASLTPYQCRLSTTLIVGGDKTSNGEFPHMAAIGWRLINGTFNFDRGGSLISDQFVLTSAFSNKVGVTSPRIVRLGVQNLRTRNDNLTEFDVSIAQIISHESYTKRKFYFDIALIKLSRRVSFTRNIRPACLWQTADINNPKIIATGWGYTETAGQTSDDLMKVDLDIVNNQHCNIFYEDYVDKLQNGIVDAQMCAGVLAGKKDTCNDDSGGPIQVRASNNPCMFHIVGITSFGSPFCGAKNWPGVYTRVSSYLDWIEDKVWR